MMRFMMVDEGREMTTCAQLINVAHLECVCRLVISAHGANGVRHVLWPLALSRTGGKHFALRQIDD